jgi:dihydrolipoamide dehydrogenase
VGDLDLVVVGAGPGGYVAAIRAAQLGLRTAVVEMERAGGVCGNWGCIPSKALIADATLFAELRDAKRRGILVDGLRADFGATIDRSRAVAAQQAKGVEHLFKKNGVAYHLGRARLGDRGVIVTDAQGKESTLDAPRVLLATGSRERVLPGIEVDGDVVVTSREALEDRRLPESVVVIGGGAIGVELAYVYASFGAKVTVVEMAETLLPGMDADLGRELARLFGRHGIEVLVGHRFEQLQHNGPGATVAVRGANGIRALPAARVLVAVGRQPLTDGLDIERRKIRTERGFVVVDEAMRTSAKDVWAIGDLVGPLMLAHTASEQGVVAVEAMAGRTSHAALDPRLVPMCVYCQPEVAAVGLTEEQARAAGPVKVGKFPFRALGKAMASGHTDGFVKIVAGARHGEILGVHMIGQGVTDLIAEGALARTLEATTGELIDTVHAHPTLAEALREAALAAEGRAVNM